MRNIVKTTSIILTTLSLSACSVGMALSGKKDPDLSVVKKGADRSEVELQLGAPIEIATGENGASIAKYAYEIGNAPSTGRAVAHGAMDLVTLGLWEIVGTPVEAVTGDKYNLTITYDKDDHILNIGHATK